MEVTDLMIVVWEHANAINTSMIRWQFLWRLQHVLHANIIVRHAVTQQVVTPAMLLTIDNSMDFRWNASVQLVFMMTWKITRNVWPVLTPVIHVKILLSVWNAVRVISGQNLLISVPASIDTMTQRAKKQNVRNAIILAKHVQTAVSVLLVKLIIQD